MHPLTDHRRILPLDKIGEILEASPDFQLVVSYNPGYQRILKDLKPSTRQRFVALDFDFPPAEREIAIVIHEGATDYATAHCLGHPRPSAARLARPGPGGSSQHAPADRHARLITSGIAAQAACRAALISPLSDDAVLVAAMRDLVDLTFI